MPAEPTPLSVDHPFEPWQGRFDGDGDAHLRWWQAVGPWPGGTSSADAAGTGAALGGSGNRGGAGNGGGAGDRGMPQPAGPRPGAQTRPAAVVLGFCSDEGVRRNQGRPGAYGGPAAIRAALSSLAWHLDRSVSDAGDVVVGGEELEAGQQRAGAAISTLLDSGALTVVLGGGHETAYASYLGVSGAEVLVGKRWGVLNLDAHFDLRNEPQPSSGTPFLQMAGAEETAGRSLHYAVVGISEPNNTRALFDTAHALDVAYVLDEDCTIPSTEQFVADFLADLDAVYLTIDLDVLPSAVAPGVSAPAALGVPLDVITAVCRQVAASGKLRHVDVAELNPSLDVDGRTAKVAARLINTLLR